MSEAPGDDRFFELSLDLAAVVGFDGRFRRLNPAWEEVFGWTVDELMARPYAEFFHDEDHVQRFGQAAIRREGTDVTLVGISRMAVTAQRAAEQLATEHEVEAEVIDPRTLRPLDLDTILESVQKTNRVVIVEEGWPHGGVGANMAALIQEQAFDYLDAPVQRVTGADVPMPYSKPLEQAAFPHAEHVVQAALATFRDV